MLKFIAAIWLLLVLYWIIGIGVSLLDRRVREWLNNLKSTEILAPVNIKTERVVQAWIIYVPVAAFLAILWSFTKGSMVVHKALYRRWFS